MNKLLFGIVAALLFLMSIETTYLYVLTQDVQNIHVTKPVPKPATLYLEPAPQPIAI